MPEFKKVVKPNKNRYSGKIYVITNGISFSASSALASNLKGTNRAFVVGEQTVGADIGCVAGMMPIVTLPNSKLELKLWMMYLKNFNSKGEVGYGIKPDVVVLPTLNDRKMV